VKQRETEGEREGGKKEEEEEAGTGRRKRVLGEKIYH
jgi:hypothetical protein